MMFNKQILIFNDSKEDKHLVSETLLKANYEVAEVEGVDAGIRMATALRPDLIIVNISHAKEEGFSLLERLMQSDITAAAAVVLVGGQREELSVRRAMRLGADDYLAAPVIPRELLEITRIKLRKAACRRAPLSEGNVFAHNAIGLQRLRAAFKASGQLNTYAPGDMVVREGQHPRYVYLVVSGFVHLTQKHNEDREYIIVGLGEGEMFGISTALEDLKYHYTALVDGKPLKVRSLKVKVFRKLVESDYSIGQSLIHLLADRATEFGDRIVQQAYDTVRKRMARLLIELWEGQTLKDINFSREELARMVGATKESVSRALTDFRKEKLIETDGRKIIVLDPSGLEALKS